jgi:twitching motility protein PilI
MRASILEEDPREVLGDAPVETEPRQWLSPSAALRRFDPPHELGGARTHSAEPVSKRYGVAIGNIRLLIEPRTVGEVLDELPVYAIPNTAPWFLGLINVRGSTVPVFDLHRLFEFADEQSQARRMLMLDRGDSAVAMHIDGFPRTVETSKKMSRLPPLPDLLRPHVREGYVKDRQFWLEFEHRGFFGDLIG